MGTQMIGNAPGAYGLPQAPDESGVQTYLNSGGTTINVNEWVSYDITGTGTHVGGVTRGLHGIAAPFNIVGIALETIAAGAYGRVCTSGVATAIAAGTISVGAQLTPSASASHDGQVTTASSPAVGAVIGYALAAGTAGNTMVIAVEKS